MNSNRWGIVGWLLVAWQLAAIGRGAQPNFVFFLADDLGWRDLGCFGSTFYETPHLDALAADGMRFTNAYAACPVCSPTRASIQTGQYPARLDTTDWFGAVQPDEAAQHPRFRAKKMLPAGYVEHLPLEEVTIAERLGDQGYQTFFAGKWHLGPEGYWPENQGYQINRGGWTRGGPYGPGKYFTPYGNPRLEDGPAGEHLPNRLASETVKFIQQRGDEPFFAFLSFYSVHTPLMTRADLKQKYEAKAQRVVHNGPRWLPEQARQARQVQDHAVYGGMVESMDQAVGKVLAALDAEGIAENTIVVFTSDNGGLSTSEGSPTSNVPLRGGKGMLFEGGIREPTIVRWPGVTVGGTQSDRPIISTDYFPTILEMAGLPYDAGSIDGRSFVPLLRGDAQAARGPIFWHYPHYGNQGGFPGAAIRLGAWKLIERFEDGQWELYNLDQDIGETNNLAGTRPVERDRLAKLLHQWQREVDAKRPTRNPDWDPQQAK